MEKIHINIIRGKMETGELTLIQPSRLCIGYNTFRRQDGTIVHIKVIKYQHL